MIKYLTPEFVEFMPEKLLPGILYISRRFSSTNHLCACGCEEAAYIPVKFKGNNFAGSSKIRDTWDIIVKDNQVTLFPSLHHRFGCRSHYYIRNNIIEWC